MKSQTIQQMIDLPIMQFWKDLQFWKKERQDYKDMSVFSHENLVISSPNGLNYLNLSDPSQRPLVIGAKKLLKTSFKDCYFSEGNNMAVS